MGDIGRVVALGGGTGLPALLEALKPSLGEAAFDEVTAVVTVADSGGSSGRLRREMGVPAPGDIRNCLVALSEAPETMRRLFQYRFPAGELEGHAFGNLFLVALAGVTGDFPSAVKQAHDVLAIKGRIYPSTLEPIELVAEMADGRELRGEWHITRDPRPIRKLRIEPRRARALPEACRALESASLILLGPGSLFTSVLPNLLVRELAEAIRASRARKVYICNLATQPGETDGFTASGHAKVLLEHCGDGLFDTILCNSAVLPEALEKLYMEQGSVPVAVDREAISGLGLAVAEEDLLQAGQYARHDPKKLRASLVKLARTAVEMP